MTYELAKQLKDAGFPQHDLEWHLRSCYGGACTPTLSELIEACGDRFRGLFRLKSGDYQASGWIKKDTQEGFRFAKNPEVAVAKLWFELNENK